MQDSQSEQSDHEDQSNQSNHEDDVEHDVGHLQVLSAGRPPQAVLDMQKRLKEARYGEQIRVMQKELNARSAGGGHQSEHLWRQSDPEPTCDIEFR